jgi:hypothetical protein
MLVPDGDIEKGWVARTGEVMENKKEQERE